MAAGGLAKHKGLRSSRNKTKYQAYRVRGTREINQKLRIKRHLRKFPKDNVARMVLEKLR